LHHFGRLLDDAGERTARGDIGRLERTVRFKRKPRKFRIIRFRRRDVAVARPGARERRDFARRLLLGGASARVERARDG
jgi:hypothetical protein